MAFDGALNNVQHLVLTANVKGLEPLLPPLTGDWNYKVQKRLFQIFGLVNLTLADSVIEGLAPLVAEPPPGDEDGTTLNPAVPRPDLYETQTEAETVARESKWASYVHVKNCTFINTDLTLFGSSNGSGSFLTTPIVESTGHACLLRLGTMYDIFWPGHVLISNTTFDNITTSAPPGSGLRLHMLCIDTNDRNDTITVRDSTFSNIQDVLGHSLDLIHTSMVYTGRLRTKNLTMQRCQFTNIKAGLLAALEVAAVTVNNCSVNGAKLAYGGFAVMSQDKQKAEFVNSSFSNIQLGAASDAIIMNQDYYNPGIGLVKTSSRASAHVQGCMFKDVSLLPPAGPLARWAPWLGKARQAADSAAFIRTAVIAAGANARVLQCTFVDCFTPAAVYAYSGEMETIGRTYSMGTANRGARDAVVSLVVHASAFVRNMYGVYADGFQVIVSNCSFTASSVSGVRVSGVPCLIVNGTKLHGAAVSVQRASNPGGTAFSFCRMGWFPLWLNDRVQAASDVPGTARVAAALHNISGRLADSFDSAVSVYMENVSISGVQGQPAVSLRDVHKASLQRVSIVDNVGRGALQASSVTGLLMLQCRVVNNSAGLAAATLNVAGGGTFTAVNSLYLLETVFAGNVGPEAGAMLLQSCGPVVINSCTYHDNTARQSGGAVRAIASESIVVDTSTLQQPDNISCMQTNVLHVMYGGYDGGFDLDMTPTYSGEAACPKARLGGRATTFSSNSAGASGGAIAIEGLTLAAFSATRVNFLDNR
jgi:predicted outer membrane repeat protein